MIKAVDAVR